ncbi:hypothetical protein C8C77_11073 [Halanaerobium saccharolyticum]|uniref:DUF2905 family protein n=1 Tax=Halanaerobium saccharolyticum TaxID=43595 RepID=A0A4R7Z2L8_9FIRM|nr:DUF2905 domain-containing protein [Halanaerobium saccharolyticum]RAK08167.1 hypothetical protein C7958_11173 [Halanaerobium saccharolyticum]TDW04374.1 hypothetical protein C8C77_11073 [Halanaerobium saccharolyticum]TDX59665.1 hypothetical protein C7956_11373 [Halanaerobium saccharolyticum]
MDFKNIGSLIIISGFVIAFVGAVIYFAGGSLSWFGNLPGDIRIERENFSFYFPLTTMILISIILNIIIKIIFYFIN